MPALVWWVSSGTPVSSAASGGSWTTYQHDRARSGVDPGQATVSSVAPTPWSVTLDALIWAQPLVVGSTVIAGTANNSVYAFDVNTHQQLWRQSVGSPVTGGLFGGCGDPNGTPGDPVGILGTPVADAAAGLVYVASMNQTGGGGLQYALTAINLSNGSIKYSAPINPAGGFDPSVQDQRAALTLSQGRVYVEFGGLSGDCGIYHGWVWSAQSTDGTSGSLTYQVPANARGASIWSPAGGSVDASGNLYVATGNAFQESTPDHSESVISLSPTLQENSFWRATDWNTLNQNDVDIGSFGPLQLNNGLIFQSGKNHVGYLLSTSNLSGAPVFMDSICGAEVMGGAAYVPPNIYVGCTTDLVQVHLSSNGQSFTHSSVRSGYHGGHASGATTPIASGGMIFNLDVGASLLVMFNPTTNQVQTFNLTSQPVHFASPSSGAGTILVPAGRDLDGFVLNSQGGVPTSTPTSAAGATSTSTPTATQPAGGSGGVVPTSTPTQAPTLPPPAPTNTPTPAPGPSGGGGGGGGGKPPGGGGGGGGGGSHPGGGGGGGGAAPPVAAAPPNPPTTSQLTATGAVAPAPPVAVAGVQIVSLDPALSVSFPGDFQVTAQVLTPDQVPAAPDGFQLGAHIVQVAASTGDSDLPSPVSLQYQIDPTDLNAANGALDHVHIAVLQGTDWIALPCSTNDQVVLNCSLTHLSTFGVVIAPTPASQLDFDLPDGGHFFKQTNGWSGAGDSGFSVVDDDNAAFWSELQRLGGVDQVGYPVSYRFVYEGLWTQAFQKEVLQWHPDLGQAQPMNLLDDLNAHGLDAWLDGQQAIPPAADTSADAGLSFDAVKARHFGLLDPYGPLQAFYLSTPDPVGTFGLPLSVKDYGPVITLRTQRAIIQLWPSGSVTVGNAGDAAKAGGLFPRSAVTPAVPS